MLARMTTAEGRRRGGHPVIEAAGDGLESVRATRQDVRAAAAPGLQAIMFPAGVARPVPAIHRAHPELFPRVHWLDTYGLDSAHDYDPVWAKCRELGFAVAFHGGSAPAIETMASRSVSNYM